MVFIYVTVPLDKHENPFIYKATVLVWVGQCLFHGPSQALFLPTKPPNWLHHVCNRPHSFDIDTSRGMLGSCFAVHQEEWSWFTGREYALNIKEQWTQRQMQLGQKKKKKENKVDTIQVYMRVPYLECKICTIRDKCGTPKRTFQRVSYQWFSCFYNKNHNKKDLVCLGLQIED